MLPFLWLLMLMLICWKCWENTQAFNLNAMKGTSDVPAGSIYYSPPPSHIFMRQAVFHRLQKWHHCTNVSFVQSLGGDNWKENRENLWTLQHLRHKRSQSGCSITVPQHKSFSAGRCSRGSYSPSFFPVGAIFNLVRCGSTGLVATWICWLCHCCRLG